MLRIDETVESVRCIVILQVGSVDDGMKVAFASQWYANRPAIIMVLSKMLL